MSSAGTHRDQFSQPSYSKLGFWSLIATQFQGGFSDNALKWIISFLILGLGLSQLERDRLFVLIVPELFSIPFILFSMFGGYLADRYSKRSVIIGTKFFEMATAAMAIAGLLQRSLVLECAAGFLMTSQAAVFGPSKYGIMPELLPEERLSWGNGILELGTFLAIILGTIAAGISTPLVKGREYWSGIALVALAVIGLFASLGISRVPAAKPDAKFRWNPLGDLLTQIGEIRKDRLLSLAVIGNMYFWFLGALLLINVVLYGTDVMHVSEEVASRLLVASSLGIAFGSFLAGYLSGGKIEYGLVPLGAVGITVITASLSRSGLSFSSVIVHLIFLGFFAGFFAVPINALIQHRPPPDRKGAIIAAANLLSFVGIAMQPIAQYAMIYIGHPNPARVFLITSLLTLGATICVAVALPDSLVHMGAWLITRPLYRLRANSRENIPETGGALLVSNHVSFVDALLLIASTERPIRFLIVKDIYDHPLIKPFVKLARAIPISTESHPRDMIKSLRKANEAVRAGEVVCIFAEGQLTRIGQLLPFRHGMTRVIRNTGAPIIPVCIDGIWGSIFSFSGGRFFWKMPRLRRLPVTVSFGKPLLPSAKSFEVREAVQALQTDEFAHHRGRMRTLHRGLIRTAHRSPFRFAMGDKRRPRMKWGGVLLSAIFLARRLRATWAGQEMVGILLPPSIPGALVNYAAVLAGKIPVNLNYTLSDEALASCIAQCSIQTVISTKLLLDRIPLQIPGKTVLLEQAAADSRFGEKMAALALWFCPGWLIERAVAQRTPKSLDDLATVIFSSGSTGEPKGVMLTHYNIAANIEQALQVFMFERRDFMLGILPFFHSFGFTDTLWLPAQIGVGVIFHPSPLDTDAIGELVRDYRVTFLISTPTFLQHYLRRCSPEDFASLRYVIVGAEKLPAALAEAFEKRFGIAPLEGYGITECSPVIAVNTRDFNAPGVRQPGAQRGSVGRPLPAISVRIIDPDTNAPMPLDTPGMLLVRGPNVMQGYLGQPKKTAEALRDGWYITGDIVSQDEDGFLTITDRLSRFSKIGGEMVPHLKVEEALQHLSGASEQSFAVTGVPDEKKGERLVVLHTISPEQLDATLAKVSETTLPNLWTPRPHQFFHVDELPRLGTGKIDLRQVRDLALEFSLVHRQ
ncbi:MAG TPA: acyl-[ACP]--phospholipid O-acyltransferase [Candidatus Acidoferrales bacterium]|jgi:acyl-[acyl-carrier-protein]-phospholipid O-acyltransferase/long-chain-fatty-acid--[acyl-carrier-protein] ligase|nr:acyl-[ACP]--phospholipid O-acyltransferase [Candidatus Acidoferrales bacterium]